MASLVHLGQLRGAILAGQCDDLALQRAVIFEVLRQVAQGVRRRQPVGGDLVGRGIDRAQPLFGEQSQADASRQNGDKGRDDA